MNQREADKVAAMQQRYEGRIENQKKIINRLQAQQAEVRANTVIELRDKFAAQEDWNAVTKLENWMPEFVG